MLSRTVRESALLFSLTEQRNGSLAPIGYVDGPSKDRLRIGVTLPQQGIDTDATYALYRMRDLLLSMGHDLIETPFPVENGAFVQAYIGFFSTRLTALRQFIEANIGSPIG